MDAYYLEFIKLKRYAPPMTKPQAMSCFVQGLNPLLNRESKRSNSLQDAILRVKPLEKRLECQFIFASSLPIQAHS